MSHSLPSGTVFSQHCPDFPLCHSTFYNTERETLYFISFFKHYWTGKTQIVFLGWHWSGFWVLSWMMSYFLGCFVQYLCLDSRCMCVFGCLISSEVLTVWFNLSESSCYLFFDFSFVQVIFWLIISCFVFMWDRPVYVRFIPPLAFLDWVRYLIIKKICVKIFL